jgi:hypothetical protein
MFEFIALVQDEKNHKNEEIQEENKRVKSLKNE